tara:strand:- start:514 stop:642 length:129 start_codon:yes stop_codon:yes gene_type:complete
MTDKKQMLISFNNIINLLEEQRKELLQEIALEEGSIVDEGEE